MTSPDGANDTQYLHVKTIDSAGNVGYANTSQGFVLDNTNPTASFSNPESTSYSRSVTTSLNVSDNITNQLNKFVMKYTIDELESSDGNDASWSSTSDGSISIDNRSGIYYIHAKVYDEAGNSTLVTGGPYLLDNDPPGGSINVAKAYTNEANVAVELTASDLHGPIDMRFSMDGGTTWGSWESFVSAKNVAIPAVEGSHTVSVQYRDSVGNESAVYQASVVYDVTPPSSSNIAYSTEAWTNQPVTAVLSATDNLTASSEIDVLNLDGFSYEFQENGEYVFHFRDQAGNESTATATVNWIDKTKPQISFSVNGTTVKSRTVSSEITASDNASTSDALKVEYAWSTDGTTAPADWSVLGSDHLVQLNAVDGVWYLWARATDEAGNRSELRSQPFLLDNTAPVGTVSYSPSGRTANDVTAVLTTNEPVTVTSPADGSSEYLFTDNGSFTFGFVDEAGNVGTVTASVYEIDRSLPSAAVSVSPGGWTNAPVRVTVDAQGDPPRELSEVTVPDDAVLISQTVQSAVYEFHTNGTLRYKLRDLDTGLVSDGEVVVNRIDLVPPTGELVYSAQSDTNQDVTVTLLATDDRSKVTILNNNGSNTYTFTQNGTFTYQFQDEAGNVSELTATVDFIDKEAPQPVLTYSETDWTTNNVNVTIAFANESKPVTITNNNGSSAYTFADNGTFTFYFRDAAGNTGQATAKVDHIDREAPTGTVVYSELGWTNQDVVATLEAVDNSGEAPLIVNNDHLNQYTFSENGSFTFTIRDAAGNERQITATADRIDKTPPNVSVQYSTTALTRADVRASVSANEPVTVANNDGATYYDFTANGSYTFQVEDRAHNVSTVTATVYGIDRTPPTASIAYSTTDATKEDVIATISADEPFQVLNNNRAKQHVFKENGRFTFIIQDLAGNTAEIEAVVNNIDKSNAKVNLKYSETAPTQNDVTVTIESDRALTFAGGADKVVTFTENGTRWLEATDALNNQYVIRVDVGNIDREKPAIQFAGGDKLLLQVGDAADPAADVLVTDNLDTGLKAKLSITNDIDTQVPGEYTVTYRVTDRAGNEAVVTRSALVIAPDRFTTYVNSKPVLADEVLVFGDAIQLKLFGQQGLSVMKWARGYKYKGDFKMNRNVLADGVLPVNEFGYYTFYVQDQERQTKLIRVYILPNQGSE